MRLFTILLAIVLLSFNISAKEKTTKSATLEIVVNDLNSDEGYLRVHLYDLAHAENFPDESESSFMMKQVKIHIGKARAVFKDIPYGKYAATLHHDLNRNVKMDLNWLGFPSEGWGLSTDMIPVFSLPNFNKCKFEVNKPKIVYPIKIRYLP